MGTRAVTINVPSALFEQLQQRAGQSRRTVEDEVVLAVASTVDRVHHLPEDLESTIGLPVGS